MTQKTTGRGSDQFNLRFPEGMRELIAAIAKKNGRSMNAEILDRIERTLEEDAADNDPRTKRFPLGTFPADTKFDFEMIIKKIDAVSEKIDDMSKDK